MDSQAVVFAFEKGEQVFCQVIKTDGRTHFTMSEHYRLNVNTPTIASMVWNPDLRLLHTLCIYGWKYTSPQVFDVGPNLDISSISDVPGVQLTETAENDSFAGCSLLYLDGQVTATIGQRTGMMIRHLESKPVEYEYLPGFWRNVLSLIAREPKYPTPVFEDRDYVRQWRFCPVRDAIAPASDELKSISNLVTLPYSNKVYGFWQNPGEHSKIKLRTLPTTAFNNAILTQDYRWFEIDVDTNGKYTTGSAFVCVQGADTSTPPRLYMFFINSASNVGTVAKGKLWYCYLPLKGSDRMYGDLDVKPGSRQIKALGISDIGVLEASTTRRLQVALCNETVVLFYQGDSSPIVMTSAVQPNGSLGEWQNQKQASQDSAALLAACTVPAVLF